MFQNKGSIMPKPILNTENLQQQNNFEDFTLQNRNTFESSELTLRKKRPQKYLGIIKDLDSGGETISKERMAEIVNTIKNEVPEIIQEDTFLGVLGKCYLDDVHDVHTLSLDIIFGVDEVTHQPGYGRMILKHYKIGEHLPEELEKGRSLAVNPNYLFVEVYKTKIIAVKQNGTVSIVKC